MQQLRGQAVLVAGGAGFVGSAVVRELLAHGARVVCYDNYLHGSPDHLSGLAGGLTALRGDVRDLDRLIATLHEHQVEHVICCVGDTFVPAGYEVPQRFVDINVKGTLNVLRAARRMSVRRMVYLSSTEVYGDRGGRRIDESAPLDPVNSYAVTKLAADRLCYTFSLEHGLPIVIARLFNCYGPRETHPYVIPEIISQLSRGPLLRLGNIHARRDLTYVTDTAGALVSLLHGDLPNGCIVNVGSGNEYEVARLARMIGRIMGLGRVDIEIDERRYRRRDIDRFRCDNTKLRDCTGWAPRVGIEEGLRRTVEWFEQNGGRWNWERSGNAEAFPTAPEDMIPTPAAGG